MILMCCFIEKQKQQPLNIYIFRSVLLEWILFGLVSCLDGISLAVSLVGAECKRWLRSQQATFLHFILFLLLFFLAGVGRM